MNLYQVTHLLKLRLVQCGPVDAKRLPAEVNIKNGFSDNLGSETSGFVLQAIYMCMCVYTKLI